MIEQYKPNGIPFSCLDALAKHVFTKEYEIAKQKPNYDAWLIDKCRKLEDK